MKVLILNGTKKEDLDINKIYKLIIDEINEFGWDLNPIILEDKNITPCMGCFHCWVKTPGICISNDFGREIAKLVHQSDILLYFTPITFGGYSYELKKALDHIIPFILPYFTKNNGEIHHKKRYEKSPSFIVIGILDKPNAEKENVFKTLVERNSFNFYPPYHASLVFTKDQNIKEIQEKLNKVLIEAEAIK